MIDKDRLRVLRLMMAVIVLLMATGCSTTRYVPVERVKTETRDKTKVITDTGRDTVVVRNDAVKHDSTAVRVQGDTVYVERWHKELRTMSEHGTSVKVRTVHDTVTVAKTDTVDGKAAMKAATEAARDADAKEKRRERVRVAVMLAVLILATGTLIYKLRKP